MALKGATELAGLLPGVVRHALGSSNLSLLRDVAGDLVPPLEALHKSGVGGKDLGHALGMLRGEAGTASFAGIYSDASLGTLSRVLRETGLHTLVDNHPSVAREAFEEGLDADRLSEIAGRWKTLVDGLPKTGPTVITPRRSSVDAREVMVLVDGDAVTAHGSLAATWAVATRSSTAVAHKARDAGLVRWIGKAGGEDQWVHADNGTPITLDEIETAWGGDLRKRTGVRDLPRPPADSEAPADVAHRRAIDSLVADFGGMAPDHMIGKAMMTLLGLDTAGLRGTPFENQAVFLSNAGLHAQLFLYSFLGALAAVGEPLSGLNRARDTAIFYGTAFDAYDKVVRLANLARDGKRLRIMKDQSLSYALAGMAPAAAANLIGPAGDFRALGAHGVWRKIVGETLDPEEGADTMGLFCTSKGACAAGATAVHWARKSLKVDRGEWRPRMMFLGAADTALVPREAPLIITGFGEEAPFSRATLTERGWQPNQASRPFMADSGGLVTGEGSATVVAMSLYDAILGGFPYLSKVIGTSARLGQGKKAHEAGVNHGIINAVLEVMRTARDSFGVSPEDFTTVLAHGTSTGPSNLEEPTALWAVLNALKYPGQMDIYASKGEIGHSMGASSLIDLALGLMIMKTGVLPGLHNFDLEGIDPRLTAAGEHSIGDVRERINFSNKTRPWRRGGMLHVSEGFGSANAAMATVEGEPEKDMEFHPGIPRSLRDSYRSRTVEREGRRDEFRDRFRRGEIKHRQVAEELGYS